MCNNKKVLYACQTISLSFQTSISRCALWCEKLLKITTTISLASGLHELIYLLAFNWLIAIDICELKIYIYFK